MPAEEGPSCLTEPGCSTIGNRGRENKNMDCDFAVCETVGMKCECNTEDDNFFKDLESTKEVKQLPKICCTSADVNDNRNWGFLTNQKVEKIQLNIKGETVCKMDSSTETGVDKSHPHQNQPQSIHQREYQFKTESELQSLSVDALKNIIRDLVSTIENVSSQLVSLLQENDTLQQESDARNIAIEQLLKLTVKQTETELRPVKMSVILPSVSDSSDEWD